MPPSVRLTNDEEQATDEPVKPRSQDVGGDLITRHNANVFWSTWGHTRSQTSASGCPTTATAAKGESIIDATIRGYLKLLREMRDAN